MTLKRITIPYETKLDFIKRLDKGEISYQGLNYNGRSITFQQVQRWKDSLKKFNLSKSDLRAAAVSAIKVAPAQASNSQAVNVHPMTRREDIEVLKLKATLCDALLKVNQLEEQISQKILERRSPEMRLALNN